VGNIKYCAVEVILQGHDTFIEMSLYDLQVVICEESHDVHDMSFVIYIARCMPLLTPDLLHHASGT
jgi:hypothetical protein